MGMRVQERINAAARNTTGTLSLTWNGFRQRSTDSALTTIDPAVEPTLRTTFKGLLRRFVPTTGSASRLK